MGQRGVQRKQGESPNEKFGAELLGESVDGVWCHLAFAEARHLHFPLLADFEPKGGVAQRYGAYRRAAGF